MTRHAKNNTANPVFSHAERQMANGGPKRQRLSAQSMAAFDACKLCLSRAKDPRVDLEGHLFCHECVVENLLTQKKDIKRQQALLATMQADEAAQRADALDQARERVLKNFERIQSGVGGSRGAGSSSKPEAPPSVAGMKRKIDVSGDTTSLDDLTSAAQDEALVQLEAEAVEARKARLPNFWLPSLTPNAAPTKLSVAEIKLESLCRVGKPVHPLTLKSLVKARFGKVGGGEAKMEGGLSNEQLCCMACAKGLTNNIKMSVLRPCGHVLCNACVDTLAKPSNACPTCDEKLDKKRGVVDLFREGTGYAAGGQAEATRFDLSFQ